MSESKKIGFSLLSISTEQFAIIEESFDTKGIVEINVGTSFVVEKEKKLVSNLFKVQFTQDKQTFLILETACHFEISQEAWIEFFVEKTNVLTLPRGFAGHLLMLNIGTSRGVLHCKTEDTVYNQFMLPTINVNNLIETDVVMDLNEEGSEE